MISALAVLPIMLSAQAQNEQLAHQYFRDGEFEKAAEVFAELYEKNPSHINTYVFYLRSLLLSNRLKEAEKVAQKQRRQFPSVLRYGVDLGYVMETAGETVKAQKQYESCIAELKNEPARIQELAGAFLMYQHYQYALKTYQQGRKLLALPDAYCGEIAAVYETGKEYQLAMNEYITLLLHQERMLDYVQTRLLTWLTGEYEEEGSQIIHASLLKAINKYPDSRVFEMLLIWYSMQRKDFSAAITLAKAIDKRYKTGGKDVYMLAVVAAQHHDFSAAKDACIYILSLSEESTPYRPFAQMLLLHSRLDEAISLYPSDEALNTETDQRISAYFAEHPVTGDRFELYRKWLLFKASHLNQMPLSKQLIAQQLEQNRLPARERAILKLDMGDILQWEGDVWEAALLYWQVEKDFPNDTIGQLAKFKNAKLSFHLGEFDWAMAQLDVLRAATSKLIANDAMYFSLLIFDNKQEEDSVNAALIRFAQADFLMDCKRWDEAWTMLDSVESEALYHSLSDDVLYRKAHICVARQQYHRADSLYSALVAAYPHDLLADDALFEQAQLHETYLKDPFQAMDLYQKLIMLYPDSIYVADARKRFQALRGK
jgi:tetratricopeptide (TPR) repeat protein